MRFDPRSFGLLAVTCVVACGPKSAPPRQVQGTPIAGATPTGEADAREVKAAGATSTTGRPQPATGPVPTPEQITPMVETSAAALRAGDRQTAERSLRPCLHRSPPVLVCELQFARFLATVPRRKTQYQETLRRLVIVDDPSMSTEAYDDLAKRLRTIGEPAMSETAVLIALSRSPTAERHSFHAKVLQGLPDRLDNAIAALRSALELAPERRDWAMELATLSARHPDHVDEAIAQFEALRTESEDEAFRRTITERIAELRRAAAISSDPNAPQRPKGTRLNHPTPPAADGGSTSR